MFCSAGGRVDKCCPSRNGNDNAHLVQQAAETEANQALLTDLGIFAPDRWHDELVDEPVQGGVILKGLFRSNTVCQLRFP
jgi:hypothetical protein